MENKDYLERIYKTNYECALKYCQQKNWTEARKSLEAAGTAILKISQIVYGSDKERYVASAKSLAQLLQEVKNREQATKGDVTMTNSPAQNKTSTNAKSKAPENGEQSEDGINYVINGVNVKDFIANESNDPVTFDDVKGMEKEKALIKREFFLSEEQRAFNEYLGKKPKTFILLYGVPGTGKTFFAKAISEELKRSSGANVPFFSVVGSQLSDCKVGATEKIFKLYLSFVNSSNTAFCLSTSSIL